MEPQLGEVIENRFRLVRPLGKGGMGTVFLAEQVDMERQVVIKLLSPELVQEVPDVVDRFRLEATAAAQLNHPNVVQLFVFGRTSGGHLYLAMEYVEGRSLAELLHDEGRLSEVRALRIVDQICAGLSAAHHAGIVHRDLKPENVMICERQGERDHVKLVDFGIAKRIVPGAPSVTRTGVVVGTPTYMAPEQALDADVDARTDIYALGCVLYEVLSGEQVFASDNLTAVLARHVTEVPAPLNQRFPQLVVQPRVVALIQRCLEKNPAARFQSARELQREIRLALEDRSSADEAEALPKSRRAEKRSSPPATSVGASVRASVVQAPLAPPRGPAVRSVFAGFVVLTSFVFGFGALVWLALR